MVSDGGKGLMWLQAEAHRVEMQECSPAGFRRRFGCVVGICGGGIEWAERRASLAFSGNVFLHALRSRHQNPHTFPTVLLHYAIEDICPFWKHNILEEHTTFIA